MACQELVRHIALTLLLLSSVSSLQGYHDSLDFVSHSVGEARAYCPTSTSITLRWDTCSLRQLSSELYGVYPTSSGVLVAFGTNVCCRSTCIAQEPGHKPRPLPASCILHAATPSDPVRRALCGERYAERFQYFVSSQRFSSGCA